MNQFQKVFDAQQAYFASGVTRSYAWRVEQLDRMGRMIKENEAALQKAMAHDFKTASQEYIFETEASFLETEYQKSQLQGWMAPQETARYCFCSGLRSPRSRPATPVFSSSPSNSARLQRG